MKLMIGQRRLCFATGVSVLVTATFAFMFLIMIMCGTELSVEDTWPFFPLCRTKNILESCMVELSSTSAGLFSVMDRRKCTLVSLMSFVMMSAVTIYQLLLSFRIKECHKKRRIRRCRVSSCLWTRRKVF